MENKDLVFEDIVEQNRRRIHYYIHRYQIYDPHGEFYQEGLVALWDAYSSYDINKGPMATYFNYVIRNRIIDKIRKKKRDNNNDQQSRDLQKIDLTDGNRKRQISTSIPLPKKEKSTILSDEFWEFVKSKLTDKQWAWVYYYILLRWSQKDIAKHFNTTVSAVNSWGKRARAKLKNEAFRKKLQTYLTV